MHQFNYSVAHDIDARLHSLHRLTKSNRVNVFGTSQSNKLNDKVCAIQKVIEQIDKTDAGLTIATEKKVNQKCMK